MVDNLTIQEGIERILQVPYSYLLTYSLVLTHPSALTHSLVLTHPFALTHSLTHSHSLVLTYILTFYRFVYGL